MGSDKEGQAAADVTQRMRHRIQHLETLVRSMMDGSHQGIAQSGNSMHRLDSTKQPDETWSTLSMDEPVGRMHILGLKTSYFSEEHWEAVMEDVCGRC